MSGIDALSQSLVPGDRLSVAAFGVAFVGGLVAGFGPCVLPMMPAVFGYVTGQTASSTDEKATRTLQGLTLAATFVLGMSLVFAAIGALAGLVGHALILGSWAYYAAASVSVILGLHLLGVISIPFDRLNRFLPQKRPERAGYLGAFLFGMLFGLIASPCSTPILAAIAGIAAVRGSVAGGAVLLFVYGLGKGVPLMLIGLASGVMTSRLASISGWVTVLNRVGGVALLGAAAYLVYLA